MAWNSVKNDPAKRFGIVAGGLENGEVGLWNANAVIQAKPDAQIFKQKAHGGAVKGLDFNTTQPNLLASGATDGEVGFLVNMM